MSVPELFPLPSPFFNVFAEAGNVQFSWGPSGFYIIHQSIVRTRNLHQLPLTPDGWAAAWQTMSSDYPKLAAKVASAVERDVAPHRQTREQEEPGKQELERLATLAVVTGCALLGGHGLGDAFVVGTECTLRFTEEGLWVHRPQRWGALMRSAYSDATALELTEVSKKASAGKVAGATLAFGVVGAAWTLTHPNVRTFIRYEAGASLEAFFSCNTATPAELGVQLPAPLSRISASQAGTSTVGELERLAELHRNGALTDQEFASLKEKLIADL